MCHQRVSAVFRLVTTLREGGVTHVSVQGANKSLTVGCQVWGSDIT